MSLETNPAIVSGYGAYSRQTHPVPSVIIEPSKRFFRLDLHVLWEYRELLYFLAWRDLKARYAQTVIGFAWTVLQPLIMMVIFTVIFSLFAKLPSDGLPYPVFVYAALVPWTYLAKSLDRSGFSVVAESNLITKVYFPRLIIPLAATLGSLVDFGVAFLLLLAMMAWYSLVPTWAILTIPIFLVVTVASSLAVSLWLSALFVKYRDIGAVIPLLTQLWMFASPVAYPMSLVPEEWRLIYKLNPMAGVIEGFRWALLNKASPDFGAMAVSVIVILILLVCGIAYFNRMERTFADVI